MPCSWLLWAQDQSLHGLCCPIVCSCSSFYNLVGSSVQALLPFSPSTSSKTFSIIILASAWAMPPSMLSHSNCRNVRSTEPIHTQPAKLIVLRCCFRQFFLSILLCPGPIPPSQESFSPDISCSIWSLSWAICTFISSLWSWSAYVQEVVLNNTHIPP